MSNQCTPNPDVAGAGDVGAFIASSLSTIAAATFAAYRIKYRQPHQHSDLLDTLLSGLSTTQLVYGSAILFALYRQHQHGFTLSVIKNDPYYHLIVYMMLANVSSGFACALALQLNGDVFKANVRALCYLVVIVLYCILLIIGYERTPSDEFCVSLVLTVLGVVCSVWTVYQSWRKKLEKRWILFTLACQIASVLIGIIQTIRLRWFEYGVQVEGCQLNSPANNNLDFGQFIALALTCSIAIQVFDAFFDNIEDDLAKPVLQRIGCYDRLKKMKQDNESSSDSADAGPRSEDHRIGLNEI